MLKQIEVLEVMDRLARLPDDATISNDLASLYLGISPSTLGAMRQAGEGPPYVQYNIPGTKARNQKVNYQMGDLRIYRESKKVGSTMAAAQVRGLCFTSIPEMLTPEPFFMQGGQIWHHALDCSREDFAAAITAELDVDWLTIYAAATEIPWVSPDYRAPLAEKFQSVLLAEGRRAASMQEYTILQAL
jgi:hypothetical protein